MIAALGVFRVPTAGTRVHLAAALATGVRAAFQNAPGVYKLGCHAIMIQVLPTNTGIVYIGDATLVGSTFTGVFGMLPIPTVNALPNFQAALTISPEGIKVEDFYCDVAVDNNGVIATVLIA